MLDSKPRYQYLLEERKGSDPGEGGGEIKGYREQKTEREKREEGSR